MPITPLRHQLFINIEELSRMNYIGVWKTLSNCNTKLVNILSLLGWTVGGGCRPGRSVFIEITSKDWPQRLWYNHRWSWHRGMASNGFTLFIYLRSNGPPTDEGDADDRRCRGMMLATYLWIQYNHTAKYCLWDITEGIGCTLRNDCHRSGDDFDRAGWWPSSWWTTCFGEDGKNFRPNLSDRVLIVCRNLIL